jgi:hypothetical protein
MKRAAPAPGSIIIPAATLAEFIARSVESYGSLRGAAEGIGVPYSTLRGWLGARFSEASREGSDAFLKHLAGLGRELEAINENVAALRVRVDALKRLTGG